MPSASEAGAVGEWLDAVLAARPDFRAPLEGARPSRRRGAELDPAGSGVLTAAVVDRLLHEPGGVRAGRLRRSAGDPVRPRRTRLPGSPGVRQGARAGVSSDPLTFRVADPDGRYAAVRLCSDLHARRRASAATATTGSSTVEAPVARLEYQLELEHADGTTETVLDPENPHRAPGRVRREVGHARRRLRAARVARGRRRRGRGRGAVDPGARARHEHARCGCGTAAAAPLLVAHDGPEYDALAGLTRYCGAMIAAGELPPHRVALLAPGAARRVVLGLGALRPRAGRRRAAGAQPGRPGRHGREPRRPGDAARPRAHAVRRAVPAVGLVLRAAPRRPRAPPSRASAGSCASRASCSATRASRARGDDLRDRRGEPRQQPR